MRRLLVLDTSALVALFAAEADDPVYRLWSRADHGEVTLLVPAVAIMDANRDVQGSIEAWAAVTYPADVVVLPLTGEAAVEIGVQPGQPGTRHVVHEALLSHGIVVTRQPDLYVGRVPFLTV